MLDDLSGDRVISDEDSARRAYPYVAWEHPLLSPGLMVPSWAVSLREAANRAGLAAFGRDLLGPLSRFFPPRPDDERALREAHGAPWYDEDDPEETARCLELEKRELEAFRRGVEAVKAAIVVFDTMPPVSGGGTQALRDEREAAAQKVLAVLSAAGVHFTDNALKSLRASAHMPGRDVPVPFVR